MEGDSSFMELLVHKQEDLNLDSQSPLKKKKKKTRPGTICSPGKSDPWSC